VRYQYRIPGWGIHQPAEGPATEVLVDFDSDASPEPMDQPTLLEAAARAHWDEHGGDDQPWPITFEVYRPGTSSPIVTGEVLSILVPEFSARILKPT